MHPCREVEERDAKYFIFARRVRCGDFMYPGFESQNKAVDEFDAFRPQIAVVGVGGGGNNTVNRLSAMDIKGAGLFAFNTDAKQLGMLGQNISRLMLGRQLTQGLGAGGFPEVGEKAATLSRMDIDLLIREKNLIFLTAGMGGGTGTGAAPVVAQIAKESGAIVIGIVTIPFALERVRLETAKKGIARLRQNVDTLIVIDNQRLVQLYPNVPIEQSFKLADEITAKAVRGITETITQPSMINLDFSDLRSIMKAGGLAMISVGEGKGHSKVEEVVKSTLTNKLLDVNYENAKGVLLHITGGADLTLGDANAIGEKITETVAADASVTWGARLDPDYNGRVEVIAIFTGVTGASVLGSDPRQGGEDSGLYRM